MKLRAILARTTADKIKSKILSPDICEVVLEVYMTPDQFSQLVTKYFESEFEVEINGTKRD